MQNSKVKETDFLINIQPQIRQIIESIEGQEFSSNDIIEGIASEFEELYIEMLLHYKGKDAFRKVHSIIAKHISNNISYYALTKMTKIKGTNVFGRESLIQQWKK
jgi:hypothetical protein